MTLAQLNNLDKATLKEVLSKCCGATAWVEQMSAAFPINYKEQLFLNAEVIWNNLSEKDWLEAFQYHPKIGDLNAIKEKFASTSQWAAGEQASVNHTSETILQEIAKGNQAYEEKFGFIFIVCATGKSAEEMLAILRSRLPNSPAEEIKIAMGEQGKITQLRLEKLLAG
ncbi:2-oxo-4-hydroxy-4-carboxy-5-ureidoimidazoline decarboxylase [Adhaeribacter aquaticus]|uniref:2-oxo-4-hydroxy-4-carboxy-5-ureidoimidazoline decarboxylase n=1 Tax=Adhaeribacter aquaticus TaxID=299567 RepID=UPI0003FB5511|nr:2-oxo-4-hydroxy-4-carboxy-5-ureidoimidazoline decarboxylase [Adhaeribacter aquaticus]